MWILISCSPASKYFTLDQFNGFLAAFGSLLLRSVRASLPVRFVDSLIDRVSLLVPLSPIDVSGFLRPHPTWPKGGANARAPPSDARDWSQGGAFPRQLGTAKGTPQCSAVRGPWTELI